MYGTENAQYYKWNQIAWQMAFIIEWENDYCHMIFNEPNQGTTIYLAEHSLCITIPTKATFYPIPNLLVCILEIIDR